MKADYDYAARFLAAVQKMIADVIDSKRPEYKYATVTALGTGNKTAQIKYPGDADSVTVRIETSTTPVVGDVVRIEGRSGDKYLAGIRR